MTTTNNAAVDEDTIRDAERYRWLKCGGWEVMQDPKYWPEHLRFDDAVDNAIASVGYGTALARFATGGE